MNALLIPVICYTLAAISTTLLWWIAREDG